MVAELVRTDAGERPDKRSGSRNRVPVLDGIRGICAVSILVMHTAYAAGLTAEGERTEVGIWGILTAGLTVMLAPFFLLSGSHLYRPFARATLAGTRRPPVRDFFLRRALRIVPAYWLVVAGAVLLINLNNVTSVWYVLRPVLALHLFVDTDTWVAATEPLWTVVTELTFYLVLPLMAGLINLYARGVDDPARRLRRILWSLGGVVVLAAGWIVYTHLPFMGSYPIENMWPPGFMGLLAIGMMFGAASAYHDVTGNEPAFYRWVGKTPLAFWLAALAVYLLNSFKPLGGAASSDYPPLDVAMVDHMWFLLFAILITAPLLVSTRSQFMENVLGNPVVKFLGRISYGIYLWHFLVLYLAFGYGNLFGTEPLPMMAMPGTPGWWELIAIVLTGTIVLATLSFYLVERPVARLGARMAKSSAPLAAT